MLTLERVESCNQRWSEETEFLLGKRNLVCISVGREQARSLKCHLPETMPSDSINKESSKLKQDSGFLFLPR